ncbi:uncharacterized protein HGUI_03814 [Hanseniaspora guilliermondii]|uniref:Uncharacterized protein n=1 Tax=Hanseniaspora guilliermondii TaxID=56406 RepID=A0A1L0CRD7_9ASCO|nr:uncharacterized protein HGUI_03814 [Hanseniaspora guilliermondii]
MLPATLLSVELMARKLLTRSTFPVISTVYYVATPELHAVSYVSDYWTGASLITADISYSTMLGSDNQEIVETIYYLSVPMSTVVSTTIDGICEGNDTSTYSTAETTLFSSNVPTVSYLYHICTPGKVLTSTAISYWSYNYTSTGKTSWTTVKEKNSTDVLVNIVDVYEPSITKTQTMFTLSPNITSVTTYSSSLMTSTIIEDGISTMEVALIYFVASPMPATTMPSITSTLAWTGHSVSYSTSTITSGHDGYEQKTPIEYVYTPEISHINATRTSMWNSSFVTTISSFSTFTNSNDQEFIDTVYIVYSTYATETITSTIAWKDNITSSASTVKTNNGADGQTTVSTIYYIYVPGVISTTYIETSYSGASLTPTATDYITNVRNSSSTDFVEIVYVNYPVETKYITTTAFGVKGSGNSTETIYYTNEFNETTKMGVTVYVVESTSSSSISKLKPSVFFSNSTQYLTTTDINTYNTTISGFFSNETVTQTTQTLSTSVSLSMTLSTSTFVSDVIVSKNVTSVETSTALISITEIIDIPTITTEMTYTNYWTDTNSHVYSVVVTSGIVNGTMEMASIYYINVPYETATATTIETYWTGTNTETITTYVYVSSLSDGSEEAVTVYYIGKPLLETTEYQKTAWINTYEYTYSTSYQTVMDPSGQQYLDTVYYVYTPTFVSAEIVSIRGYEGSITETYSTDVVYSTGSDGSTTTYIQYYVQTPMSTSNQFRYVNSTSVSSSTVGGESSLVTGPVSVPTSLDLSSFMTETATSSTNNMLTVTTVTLPPLLVTTTSSTISLTGIPTFTETIGILNSTIVSSVVVTSDIVSSAVYTSTSTYTRLYSSAVQSSIVYTYDTLVNSTISNVESTKIVTLYSTSTETLTNVFSYSSGVATTEPSASYVNSQTESDSIASDILSSSNNLQPESSLTFETKSNGVKTITSYGSNVYSQTLISGTSSTTAVITSIYSSIYSISGTSDTSVSSPGIVSSLPIDNNHSNTKQKRKVTIYETVSVTETASPVTEYQTMKIEITSTVTVTPRGSVHIVSSTSTPSSSTIIDGNGSNLSENTSKPNGGSSSANEVYTSVNLSQTPTAASSEFASSTNVSSETTTAYIISPNENSAHSNNKLSKYYIWTVLLLIFL